MLEHWGEQGKLHQQITGPDKYHLHIPVPPPSFRLFLPVTFQGTLASNLVLAAMYSLSRLQTLSAMVCILLLTCPWPAWQALRGGASWQADAAVHKDCAAGTTFKTWNETPFLLRLSTDKRSG